jgi:nicotinamidase-related amidase
MKQALVVIDVQNDYFPGGGFPLWNSGEVLGQVERAIGEARGQGVPVILVQHVVPKVAGPGPFFNEGTEGAALHPRVREMAPDAPVVVKTEADGFRGTQLGELLDRMGVDEILVCGMMTQNCVTHTAISPHAGKYRVKVLGDCCTTVSEVLHFLALHALGARVEVVGMGEAF